MKRHVHLKIGVKFYVAIGLWPLKFKSRPLGVLYRLLKATTLTIVLAFLAAELIQLYVVFGKNMLDFLALTGVNLMYNVSLAKTWIIQRPAIQKLVDKINATEHNIVDGADEDVKRIYLKHVKKNYFANRLWATLTYTCVTMFFLTPILTQLGQDFQGVDDGADNATEANAQRMLPLICWFPFDTDRHYVAAYTFQGFVLTVHPTYLIACNNILNGLSIFTIGQLKILQANVTNAANAGKKSRDIGASLRKCVIYHKAIIRFVEELNHVMKTFLMFDFASCALQISVLGFQLAVVGLSFVMLNTIVYILTMLTQLFLFYWYANEIILESMEVANAAYNSPWYLYNISNKKTLWMIMKRAQKPLTLQVGPLYVMSTQTMVSILRAGYSYAAIMRRLYKP